jgi:hypothetical protein
MSAVGLATSRVIPISQPAEPGRQKQTKRQPLNEGVGSSCRATSFDDDLLFERHAFGGYLRIRRPAFGTRIPLKDHSRSGFPHGCEPAQDLVAVRDSDGI